MFYESERDFQNKPVDAFKTAGCGAHIHSSIEILLVEKGNMHTIINGNSINLCEMDIAVCNSYDIHRFITNESTTAYVIIVPKNLISNYSSILKNKVFKNNVIQDSETFNNLLIIYKMIKYYQKNKNNFCSGALALSAFSIVLDKIQLIDKKNSDNFDFKEILYYIYNNYTEPLTLKNIALKFGYSPNHLSYKFNNYANINLTSFINNLRLDKSIEYLKQGKNIIEASESSGFQSLRTFYRCFKEKYNTSPKKILKSQL